MLRCNGIAGVGLDLGSPDQADGEQEPQTELLLDRAAARLRRAGLLEAAADRFEERDPGQRSSLRGPVTRRTLEQLPAPSQRRVSMHRPAKDPRREPAEDLRADGVVARALGVNEAPFERLRRCSVAAERDIGI